MFDAASGIFCARYDFLDFVRSKRATTSVYPDDERADGQDLSEFTIDQRVASYGNPEDEHLPSERLVWLVEQFKDDPELLEILRLQLEPAGYNAFSSRELAKRLLVPTAGAASLRSPISRNSTSWKTVPMPRQELCLAYNFVRSVAVPP